MTRRQQRIVPPGEQDLEETAELPALQLSEETGEIPEAGRVAQPTAPAPAPVVEPPGAALVAPESGHHTAIEENLSSLTLSLRELEDQLNHKSEQLSLFEREVGARDARIEALRLDLQKRDHDLQEIDARMSEREATLQQLNASRDQLEQELHRTQGELVQVRQRQSDLEAQRSRHEQQQARLETELSELRVRGERHRETLHSVEARRGFFDSLLGERDRADADQQARIASLDKLNEDLRRAVSAREQELSAALERERNQEQELRQQLQESAERAAGLRAELEAALAVAEQRQVALLAELARTEALTASGSQLQLRLDDSLREHAAAREKLDQLEQELSDHREMVRAQQQQMAVLRAAEEALRADRSAAEDSIRRYESDLRQREAAIARLEKNEAELRDQNADLSRQLEERAGLIKRLEAEAASSAAVLGNIRQNLQRIGKSDAPAQGPTPAPAGERPPPQATPAAASLSASARIAILPVPRNADHLLVRTEGDTGIVHQLGKRTTIGRKSDNNLQIEADFISRHHALILVGERETVIEDLNSANGVYVNGTRVARKELREGDLVTIGKTEFRYVLKPLGERAGDRGG